MPTCAATVPLGAACAENRKTTQESPAYRGPTGFRHGPGGPTYDLSRVQKSALIGRRDKVPFAYRETTSPESALRIP